MTVCEDNVPVTLTASGAEAPYVQYDFYLQTGTGNILVQSSTANTFDAMMSGDYFVEVEDNNGCRDVSTAITVTIEQIPTIDAGIDQQLCNTTTANLTGTTSSGAGVWSTTSTATVDANTGAVTGMTAGSCYTFTWTVTDGNCVVADDVEVCIDEMPTANAGSDQTVCGTSVILAGNVPAVGLSLIHI